MAEALNQNDLEVSKQRPSAIFGEYNPIESEFELIRTANSV